MLLYKNVDICDLKSIMENGILSMDECGNDNWDEGKRAENDTSMVQHCWRFNVKQKKIKLVKQIHM